MSEEKVLTLRGKKAVWAPGGGSGPIDPKRLPEGYPYKEVTVVNEPLNLTFGDGWYKNIDDPVVVDEFFYKVSDLALTDEEIKDITVTHNTAPGEPASISDFWDAAVANGRVTDDGCMVLEDMVPIVFVRGANGYNLVDVDGDVFFPEPGIYLARSHYGYYSSLTTTKPIEQTTETIHPMAPEFLPALTSPNGTKYQLTVADDGTLSAVAVS